MSTQLSSHFEQARIAKGLKPGQLARLIGCTNVSKIGNRIRQFELNGHIQVDLLRKLTTALGISDETVRQLVEQDRREFFEAWLKWVNEPAQPYLVIRLIPAIYTNRKMPPEIKTQEEAETWAASVAAELKLRCCLVWSRRLSCWFNADGTLSHRSEAVPGELNSPYMQIGNKKILFGEEFRSFRSVDWPKTPTALSDDKVNG